MKKIIILIAVIIVIVIISCGIYYIKNQSQSTPEETLKEYISLLQNNDYSSLYNLLSENSKKDISQEEFIERNKNIYEGISANDYKIDIKSVEQKEDKTYKISYYYSMNTIVGEVKFDTSANLIKNPETNKYELEWSSNFIYPNLNKNDKIRVRTIESKRGSILDRNGTVLAGLGEISSVGLVPGKMNEDKEKDIERISELLDISVESINKALNASYVKSDTFVPIKKISATNEELKNNLLEIPGIKISRDKDRVYPLAEASAHLIGYIQNVTAEDLEKNPDKGYTQNSFIGKSGLEKQFEDRLRGKNGKEIYIEDENGNEKQIIGSVAVQDGENIKLTIDSSIQQKLYDELKNDKGFFVVMQPKTGELLALVSTPSYNNNEFIYGIGTERWKELSEDENNPMYARYTKTWCPGSTFKPITGAIALTTESLNTEDTFNYSGLSWQKDSSWGDYFITTLTEYNSPKNIKNALIHSDNIFFAQAALKIGKDNFINSLKNIGFGENLNLNLGISPSQISNDGELKTEVSLADSGYGQGQILVNPVHMASIYSAFVNNGNMIKPYLEYKEDLQTEYLKEQVFSEEAANIIKEDLIQVIENPEGTATDMKISGISLAGKTGTAELKDSKEELAETLGWFDLITVDDSLNKQYIVISMIEDARDLGGSHYLISKIRKLFQ